MTVLKQSAITGTPGSNATTASTGFDSMQPASGTSATNLVDTVGGLLAYRSNPTSAVAYGIWTPGAAQTDFYIAADFYYPTASTISSKKMLAFIDASAVQSCAISSASIASGTGPGKLVLRNAANTAVLTTPGFAPNAQWCRIEAHVVCAGAAGTMQVRIYTNASDTTALYDSGVVTVSNGTSVASVRVGNGDTSGIDASFVNVRLGDSAGGWLGPFGVAAASGTASISVDASATGSQPGAHGDASIIVTASASAQAAATGTASISVTGTAAPVTAISRFLALPTVQRNVAHRGGETDFPEMTLYAYAQCAAISSVAAFNVDCWYSSDGVPVASHDQTTGRVFGTNFDIPTTSWATLSSLTTLSGGKPICKVTDILDVYAASRVMFIENKQGGSVRAAFNAMLAAYPTALTNFVYKASYGDVTGLAAAKAANAVGAGWGYWFASDTANLTVAKAAPWDILGEDYTASSADWTTILGLASGRVVLGHVIASVANATTAYGLGAQGLMTAKILGVVPLDGVTGTGSISVAASGVARAAATGSAQITVTATPPGVIAGSASGTAGLIVTATPSASSVATTGTAAFTLTATASALIAASGTASLTVTATASVAGSGTGTAALTITATASSATRPATGTARVTVTATGTGRASGLGGLGGSFPGVYYVDTVSVSTYQGRGALADVYAANVPVACYVDDERKLVLDGDGAEVMSSTTIYAAPSSLALFTVGSLVTLDNATTKVITARNRRHPLAPEINHVEIALI